MLPLTQHWVTQGCSRGVRTTEPRGADNRDEGCGQQSRGVWSMVPRMRTMVPRGADNGADGADNGAEGCGQWS